MKLAISLEGVVSGEHGIGLTKLDYLEPRQIQDFVDYKKRVDPEGRFNKGKLLPGADLKNAYTPSFSLIGAESLILEQSEIGRVTELPGIQVVGMMTMAPLTADLHLVRRTFRAAYELWEEAARQLPRFRAEELSMGMSNDFEVAVEEGATLVRVGSSIFGERG